MIWNDRLSIYLQRDPRREGNLWDIKEIVLEVNQLPSFLIPRYLNFGKININIAFSPLYNEDMDRKDG